LDAGNRGTSSLFPLFACENQNRGPSTLGTTSPDAPGRAGELWWVSQHLAHREAAASTGR
jgi:hypothetical protein